MLLGVGRIINPRELEAAIEMGFDMIVAPDSGMGGGRERIEIRQAGPRRQMLRRAGSILAVRVLLFSRAGGWPGTGRNQGLQRERVWTERNRRTARALPARPPQRQDNHANGRSERKDRRWLSGADQQARILPGARDVGS